MYEIHARFEILTMVNMKLFAASVIRVEHSPKMEAVYSSATLVSLYHSTQSITAQKTVTFINLDDIPYYSSIYTLVLQLFSSLRSSYPELCMHLLVPSCASHTLFISPFKFVSPSCTGQMQ
jgi:hypothetical protein